MNWELIYTKGASTLLIVLFFLLIVVFLRFLYGPRGIFRDPRWDKWNEEARREEERKKDAGLRKAFLAYARGFLTGDAEEDAALNVKVEHSMRVLEHASELALAEPLFAGPEIARALRLAALFHDVGRFEQFRRYRTFADALSCNHGTLGARVIREQGFLEGESRDMRRLVMTAVAAHNRLDLPSSVSGPARDVLIGLRDADKLDILRVVEQNLAPGTGGDSVVLLHLKDEPASWSPEVLRALEAGRVALYSDMRFINDFRILLCTWLFDLRFPTSLRIVRREGYFDRILAGLAHLPEIEAKARAVVEQRLARTS